MIGYRGLPDLLAVMRAGATGTPEVSQADIDDSDLATAQTILRMIDLIKESCVDSLTQQIAGQAVSSWARPSLLSAASAAGDPHSIAWACWWATKHMMHFVQDAPALARMFGPHDALELLISPAAMLRSRQMEGDCDDFTMMICVLLACNDVPFEICTVAASADDPSRFSHVYPRAVMPDGTRIALDASHGKYSGWEVPKSRQFRLQVWNEQGEPIADEAKARWDGLHGYTMARGGMRGLRGWGLGQDDGDDDGTVGETSTTVDSGAGSTSSSLPLPIACAGGTVLSSDGSSCVAPPVSTSTTLPGLATPAQIAAGDNTCLSTYQSDCPAGTSWIPATNPFTGGAAVNSSGQYVNSSGQPVSQGAAAVASIVNSIANAFGAATTVTTCNAQGVCTTAPANSAAATAAAGSINSSYLLWGGLAIVGIAVLAMMSHK